MQPAFGAGLGYLETALADLCFLMLHHAVVEGMADVPSAALEAGAATRWGGAWTQSTRPFAETSKVALCGGLDGVRYAVGDEPPDAILSTEPGRTGGHVRFEPDAVRTPAGPSTAPLAVVGFAFADRELELGIGPLEAARSAG
jgi:hypothetical protein